jgi:hypothetical protein
MAVSSCASQMSDSGGGTDSNTHFLQDCSSDADCDGLACECGICTERCSRDAACQKLSTTAFCSAYSGCAAPICLDETALSRVEDGANPASDDAAGVAESGAEDASIKAEPLPDANPLELASEACDQLTCSSISVEPELAPDGGSNSIPCSLGVSSPPEGELHGGVTVRITLADGSDPLVPFVEARSECDAAQPGWYYTATPSGLHVALCPRTCADAELGFEVRYTCLPVPEAALCPLLGPPPGL